MKPYRDEQFFPGKLAASAASGLELCTIIEPDIDGAVLKEFMAGLDDNHRRTLRLWMLYVARSDAGLRDAAFQCLGDGMFVQRQAETTT